jgi:hypothetical protein
MSNVGSRISAESLANAGIFYPQERNKSGKRKLRRYWSNTKNETPTTNLHPHHEVHGVRKGRVARIVMPMQVIAKIGSGKSGSDIHRWLDPPLHLRAEDVQDLKTIMSKQ